MDLTEIRNRVLKKLPDLDSFDVDDYINMVQRSHIQPYARVQREIDQVVEVTEIILGYGLTDYGNSPYGAAEINSPPDLYKVIYMHEVSNSNDIKELPIINEKDKYSYGIRMFNDKIYLQAKPGTYTVRMGYHKKLKDLGPGNNKVTVPEIEDIWHDLYWLGVLALENEAQYGNRFFRLLEDFKLERLRKVNPGTRKVKQRRWW